MPISYERGLHEVADGVFTFLQPPGTWGLSNASLVVGDGESLLIDTFFDLNLTRALLDATRGATQAAPIRTLVNTHAHGDHAWGNQLVEGAEIVASRACAEELGETSPALFLAALADPAAMGKIGEFFSRAFGSFDFEGITVTLPTRTFDGEIALEVGGREVRLIEVGPAHSRGDVLVHLPREEVLIAGDVLFVGGYPATFSGSISGWLAALDRLASLDPDVVVPGHGPVATIEDAASLRTFLEYVSREARARYEGGMPALEAARAIPLGAYEAWHHPERVGGLVAAAYRDFGAPDAPATPVEIVSIMAELSC